MHVVVVFLALLELIKSGAVVATQGDTYGTIEITLLRDVDPEQLLLISSEEAAG